jgi:hypothetical protein
MNDERAHFPAAATEIARMPDVAAVLHAAHVATGQTLTRNESA